MPRFIPRWLFQTLGVVLVLGSLRCSGLLVAFKLPPWPTLAANTNPHAAGLMIVAVSLIAILPPLLPMRLFTDIPTLAAELGKVREAGGLGAFGSAARTQRG